MVWSQVLSGSTVRQERLVPCAGDASSVVSGGVEFGRCVVSVIDINIRSRYAAKERSSIKSGPASDNAAGAHGEGRELLGGVPVSARLAAQIRAMNSAVRNSSTSAPTTRPEGGAVSHVSSMLQKMRAESSDAHDPSGDSKPTQSEFKSWHDQIEQVRQSMSLEADPRASDAPAVIADVAVPQVEVAPVALVETLFDGVMAASSRACIAALHRSFVNDNAFDLASPEPVASDPSEVADYASAPSVSAKRAMIQQAAMAMIKKARQAQEQGQ